MGVRAALWVAAAGVVGAQLVATRSGCAAGSRRPPRASLAASRLPTRPAARVAGARAARGQRRCAARAGDRRGRLGGARRGRASALPLRTRHRGRGRGARRRSRRSHDHRAPCDRDRGRCRPWSRRRPGAPRRVRRPTSEASRGRRGCVRRPRCARPAASPTREASTSSGYLARRGIRVVALGLGTGASPRVPQRTRGVMMRLQRWRARLGRAIARAVPAPRAAVLAPWCWVTRAASMSGCATAFTRAGVVHVLSVSGTAHRSGRARELRAASAGCSARSERLLLALDVRRVAALASLGPVAVVRRARRPGGRDPALGRSWRRSGSAQLLCGRRVDVLATLALAAAVVALVWPGAPREIAFQLSFVSVLALVLGTRRWAHAAKSWSGRLRTALVVAASALVGTAPLTALPLPAGVARWALLANPLVIPLFGSAVVGARARRRLCRAGHSRRCGGAVPRRRSRVAAGRGRSSSGWRRPCLGGARRAASERRRAGAALRPARGRRPAVRARAALAARGRGERRAAGRRRAGGCASAGRRACCASHSSTSARVTRRSSSCPTVACWSSTRAGSPGSEFDTGAAIVAPYLATRKIRTVDALVMTHAHPDHSGGLPHLLRRVCARGSSGGPAGRARDENGRASSARSRDRRAGARRCTRGWTVPAFAGRVAVLHPPAGWTAAGAQRGLAHASPDATGRRACCSPGDVEARGGERA